MLGGGIATTTTKTKTSGKKFPSCKCRNWTALTNTRAAQQHAQTKLLFSVVRWGGNPAEMVSSFSVGFMCYLRASSAQAGTAVQLCSQWRWHWPDLSREGGTFGDTSEEPAARTAVAKAPPWGSVSEAPELVVLSWSPRQTQVKRRCYIWVRNPNFAPVRWGNASHSNPFHSLVALENKRYALDLFRPRVQQQSEIHRVRYSLLLDQLEALEGKKQTSY